MRSRTAAFASVVALGFTIVAVPADAAPKKKDGALSPARTQVIIRPGSRVISGQGTMITTIGPGGVMQTRYVAQRRSFLDPGTDTTPGEKLPGGVYVPLAYSPTSNIDVLSPSGSFRRQPLADPWDIPSYKFP
ncbi:MAG: hypothetical protein ACLPKB_28715 [Xanthobacteraceae bacterium]